MNERFLPTHVGIIMDGNGRWAQKRGLPRKMGHRAGASTFKEIARYANKIGLKYLTAYVFSTENWKRPQDEVDSIIALLRSYLDEMDGYAKENIRVRFIGDRTSFDDDIRDRIDADFGNQLRRSCGNYKRCAENRRGSRERHASAGRDNGGIFLPLSLYQRYPGCRSDYPPERRVPAVEFPDLAVRLCRICVYGRCPLAQF